jgi:hypothetical protein
MLYIFCLWQHRSRSLRYRCVMALGGPVCIRANEMPDPCIARSWSFSWWLLLLGLCRFGVPCPLVPSNTQMHMYSGTHCPRLPEAHVYGWLCPECNTETRSFFHGRHTSHFSPHAAVALEQNRCLLHQRKHSMTAKARQDPAFPCHREPRYYIISASTLRDAVAGTRACSPAAPPAVLLTT